jgi:uncharacterized membrane protein
MVFLVTLSCDSVAFFQFHEGQYARFKQCQAMSRKEQQLWAFCPGCVLCGCGVGEKK